MSTSILEAKNVKKYFETDEGFIANLLNRTEDIQAVDGVSLQLEENEVQGVIGESGCGKTTLLMVLMGLENPTGGDVVYHDKPFSEFTKKDWKWYRRNVQIIFQDPFNSLDPKMTVRDTLTEPVEIHGLDNGEQRIVEALEDAELEPAQKYLDQRPAQLSGGEKQRVSIARALVLDPQVILADEPVSMLDVSTQASILQLLSRLIEERDTSMVYISHDLSTVSYVCDKINVMYLGRIVEQASTDEIIDNPKHPYTKALIQAIPSINPHDNRSRTELKGSTPDPSNIGEGCRFRDRCPERMDICEKTPLFLEEDDHYVACHLYYDHETKMDQKSS